MKHKRTAFLLFIVLALQMLPVKQAVQYFFIDNVLSEELVHTNKSAEKQITADDDLLFQHFALTENSTNPQNTIDSKSFTVNLPLTVSKEIHTPPPNNKL
ncbi:MAG: hypothetical protein ACOYKE_01010 [Ferruginibacter sp.]